jgi:hypothetical protein
MHSSMLDLDHPRNKAIATMQASVPADLWQQNAAFVQALRQAIANHPVTRHAAIEVLNRGDLDATSMRRIHLEYRHAIVQIFTDALLAAQMQTRQLEPRLRPGAKLAPRFLITLNDLDEFGFRPGCDKEGYYRGNPAYAHYLCLNACLMTMESPWMSGKPTCQVAVPALCVHFSNAAIAITCT